MSAPVLIVPTPALESENPRRRANLTCDAPPLEDLQPVDSAVGLGQLGGTELGEAGVSDGFDAAPHYEHRPQSSHTTAPHYYLVPDTRDSHPHRQRRRQRDGQLESIMETGRELDRDFPPAVRRNDRRLSLIQDQGLAGHSDGGVLAAETLTDARPAPGPPPAPPEYEDPQHTERAGARSVIIGSTIAIPPGVNLRDNAENCLPIPVHLEVEDGLIPVELEDMSVGYIDRSRTSAHVEPLGSGRLDLDHTWEQSSQETANLSSVPPEELVRRPSAAPSAAVSALSIALPGEEVIFDQDLKVGSVMEIGHLSIWRSELSGELRIQCISASEGKQTMWMKSQSGQLVPLYAYRPGSSLRVYLRDKERPHAPTPTFEFSGLEDLFKLQNAILGERVILDISSAKWLRINRLADSSKSETHTSIRVQVWHETRKTSVPRRLSSDSRASTASSDGLSGPRKEYLEPLTSRLVVYFSKEEGYMTLNITDDVELEDKSSTGVKLKARRYGGLRRRKSAPGVKARLVTAAHSGGEPAGLFFNHGFEDNKSLEYYKGFDIEFETENSKTEFVSTWGDVIEYRRKERVKIEKVRERMGKETFTGKAAISIKF